MRNSAPKHDWETHQLFMKYRDKPSCPMAGLIPEKGGKTTRRITKDSEHSNPVIRSFIIFLRRGLYTGGLSHPNVKALFAYLRVSHKSGQADFNICTIFSAWAHKSATKKSASV